MSLTKRTVSGVLWRGSSNILMTILNFAILAVLAHILMPSDFGLMAIILVVTGFVSILADLGLSAAIIQKQNITREQLSTLFYLNLLLGVALAGSCFALSGVFANFFKHQELAGLLKVISLTFLISSGGQVFDSLLQKEMSFGLLFKIDIVEMIIYGAVAIVFALRGFGVWSLVCGFIMRVIVRVLLLWITASQRPGFIFNLKAVRGYLHFGIYIFGDRVLNYFNRNLDNILIGRMLGAEALGFYTLAYSLMLTPVSKIASPVSSVIFPAFSIVQHDNKKIREGYLQVVKYISLLTFPMMAGLFATAPEFIISVYGAKWQPSILILQIFCLVGAIQSVGTTVGSVQYAKGRPDLSFKWGCLAVVVNATAFIIGVRWGILGVTCAYLIAALVLEPTIQGWTNRLIDLRWPEFLKQFTIQAKGAGLIIIAILALKILLQKQLGVAPLFVLMASVVVGVLIYSALLFFTGKDLLIQGAGYLRGKIKR